MPELTNEMAGRRLHFIAIGGAGMSGLALACHALGASVTGSDRAESGYLRRLRAAGIEPLIGHDPEAVPADADVVVSTAIPADNPELIRARRRDQRVIHRGELLAELCAMKRLIAVAGAHGKTTTSGMLAHALSSAGADPAFLLGGELPKVTPTGSSASRPVRSGREKPRRQDREPEGQRRSSASRPVRSGREKLRGQDRTAGELLATNASWGAGDWVIAEADESDGSFLELRPEVAVVTNVELDHHSHWGGEAELIAAFARFSNPAAALVRPAGLRLAALDGAGSVLSFTLVAGRGGRADPAGMLATDVTAIDGGSEFTIISEALGERRVRLGVPGRHNVANAVAAIGALERARELDPELPGMDALIEAFATFPGMARRLERKGRTPHGALVYDDYAHHPTEVEASLAALRELPHRRLIAVFQPHLYSRTKALAGRFGRALATADEIAVVEIYPARERPVGPLQGVSGLSVAEAAADAAPGRRVRWLGGLERAEPALAGELGEGDILVTLGAGDVDRLADALVAGEGGRP